MDAPAPRTVTAAVARNCVAAAVLAPGCAVALGAALLQDAGAWPRLVVTAAGLALIWCIVNLAIWHEAPDERRLASMVAPLPEGVRVQSLRAFTIRAVLWTSPIVALLVVMQSFLGPVGFAAASGNLAGGVLVSVIRVTRFRRFEGRAGARLLSGVAGGRSVYYVRPA